MMAGRPALALALAVAVAVALVGGQQPTDENNNDKPAGCAKGELGQIEL